MVGIDLVVEKDYFEGQTSLAEVGRVEDRKACPGNQVRVRSRWAEDRSHHDRYHTDCNSLVEIDYVEDSQAVVDFARDLVEDLKEHQAEGDEMRSTCDF